MLGRAFSFSSRSRISFSADSKSKRAPCLIMGPEILTGAAGRSLLSSRIVPRLPLRFQPPAVVLSVLDSRTVPRLPLRFQLSAMEWLREGG
jgi:hypothetical protein